MERDKELVATGEAKGRDILSTLMRSRHADAEGKRLSDDVILDNVRQFCYRTFPPVVDHVLIRLQLWSWSDTRQLPTSST